MNVAVVGQAKAARAGSRARHALALAGRYPFATACVASAAIAALSAAVLPTVPSYDPWSWIVWGREVTDPHLSFTVAGGPSWKPLPVIFTTIYAPFGGASPTLWLITARAGGVLALLAAYRLSARIVARDGTSRTWAAVAGVTAAAGVLLTQQWFYYMFRGTSEPMLVGCSLWAIDRHLEGRFRQAFALGVGASLIRPEAWPFVLLYAVWLWRREARVQGRGGSRVGRGLIAMGLFSIPFFWFVPPWIGTGQPFLAATHAQDYNGHLGSDPFVEVLRRGADLQVLPALVLGLLAVAFAWRRGRDRLVLGFAAAALAWWVLVVMMTLDGYPGLERFYLPAAGVICVLAGAGLVWVARAVARDARAASACALVLAAIAVPFTLGRIDTAADAKPTAAQAVTRLDQLTAAVAAVGGHDGVYPCKSSFAAVNHAVQTALAWKLHVTLERVGTTMAHPGIWFVGPHDSIDGGPAPLINGIDRTKLIATVGAWRVYRAWRASQGQLPCIGR